MLSKVWHKSRIFFNISHKLSMKKALNCVNHLPQNPPARSKLKSFYFWGRDLKTSPKLLYYFKVLFSWSCSKPLPTINGRNWDKETGGWFNMGLCFNAYLIILQNNRDLNRIKCTVHTCDVFVLQACSDNCQSL